MKSEGSVDLDAIVKAARERLPSIVNQIDALVRRTDPVELLAHLSLIFQTHRVDEIANRDEMTGWQARIEWLTWLICARRIVPPELPAVLDGSILTALEGLLDEYFQSVAITLMESDETLSPEHRRLRHSLRLESLFVRGEGFQHQLEESAIELYSPHDRWCEATLGITIRDALAVTNLLNERLTHKLADTRRRGEEIRTALKRQPGIALELPLPPVIQAELAEAMPEAGHEEAFAQSIEQVWFFFQAPQIVGFTRDELVHLVPADFVASRVDGFLRLMSFNADTVSGEPDPLVLSPLAKTPLLHAGDLYLPLTPGTLLEGLFYAFHTKLFAQNRHVYDDSRAAIMEAAAIDALRRLLPRAHGGWRLRYGSKKQRLDLDGLLLYDGKLILVECKWKNLQLLSRTGDVGAALADLDKAILQPLAQAQRARDFIRDVREAEFEEQETGRKIVVRSSEINEVFLVTLVGSGAWAQIAANLPRLAPLGLFRDGEYPWALCLNDLRVVSECLQGLPPLLFDYLRRRDRFQKDGRFQLHDEWDFLGVYMSGALDVDDPNFPKDVDWITLDAFDSGLQDYYASQAPGSEVKVERPRRQIPQNLWQLLVDAELTSGPGRTDTLCVVLGWSDAELRDVDEMLAKLAQKTRRDGKAHAVAARHPSRSVGIAMACGHGDQSAIQRLLNRAIETHQAERGVAEWVGFGIDLATPFIPLMLRTRFE